MKRINRLRNNYVLYINLFKNFCQNMKESINNLKTSVSFRNLSHSEF